MPNEAATIIDRIYQDNLQLINFLSQAKEISLLNDAESNFRKNLLLSTASFFETKISELLVSFIEKRSNGCVEMVFFVKNKAVERQYHTYFEWKDAKNANKFFGLFGSEFKASAEAEIKSNTEIKEGMLAFLELGRDRNTLVHENFASFPLEKTAQEIYEKYQKARKFIAFLESKLTPQEMDVKSIAV